MRITVYKEVDHGEKGKEEVRMKEKRNERKKIERMNKRMNKRKKGRKKETGHSTKS